MAGTILDSEGQPANGNSGPWWARSIWALGPLTIIALGVVYVLAVEVRSDARAAAESAAQTKTELATHHRHTESLHQKIEDYLRVQNLLTRQLCANSAKTNEERRACFQP